MICESLPHFFEIPLGQTRANSMIPPKQLFLPSLKNDFLQSKRSCKSDPLSIILIDPPSALCNRWPVSIKTVWGTVTRTAPSQVNTLDDVLALRFVIDLTLDSMFGFCWLRDQFKLVYIRRLRRRLARSYWTGARIWPHQTP